MLPLDPLRVGIVCVTLAAACAADVRRRTIPNALTLPCLLIGLALAWHSGSLGPALAGVGVASLVLPLYAGRMLGAGDVKLFWAIGALTGPLFTLWTLLLSAVAGGVLALLWAARQGVLGQTLRHAALAGQVLLATRAVPPSAASTPGEKMPYAPAIALGVLAAFWRHHLGAGP